MLKRYSHGKQDQWSIGTDVIGLQKHIEDCVPSGQLDLTLWNVLCGLSDPIDPFLEFTGDMPFCRTMSFELYPAASPVLLALSSVLKTVPLPQMEIDWRIPTDTPEAVRFQISHSWVPSCFVPTIALELARIITPHSHAGLINSIQTEVTFLDAQYRWPRGDSSYHKRQLDATPGSEVGALDLEWAMKVETLSRDPTPNRDEFRIQSVAVPARWLIETPGVVHPEIEPWTENIFLWGRDHYVRLKCPPGSIVSLWIYFVGPTQQLTGLWAVGGMLKAQMQTIESCRTFHNITEMD